MYCQHKSTRDNMNAQTIATDTVMGYSSRMETPDHEKARVHFKQFLKTQKRGAMQSAAKALEIDRTHLSNWKSGKKDMGDIHVLHLMQHMAANGYPIKVETIAKSVQGSTVSELLASEFFALGNTLASPFVPEELKRQKF